jgi:predicted RNase H-like nuclease (RuvC/YqgF family)
MSLSDTETIALRQLEQHRQHTETLSKQVREQAARIATLELENAHAHDANARLASELEDLRRAARVDTHRELYELVQHHGDAPRLPAGKQEGAMRLEGDKS